MKEKDIEDKICRYARTKYGALAFKFTSPGRRSVPDRLFLLDGGLSFFVEFKAPGKVPTEAQEREIKRLREKDHIVAVIDDVEVGKGFVDSMAKLT